MAETNESDDILNENKKVKIGSSAANPLLLDDSPEVPTSSQEIKLNEEILHYPIGKPTKAIISRRDVLRLAPDCFLNDSLIDFYLNYLKEIVAPSSLQAKFEVVSSFFYQRAKNLIQEDLLKNEKWSKKAELMDKKYLFIPVNGDYHWSLVVICNIGSVLQDRSKTKNSNDKAVILYMDSLKGFHNQKEIGDVLREYFTALINNTSKVIALDCEFELNKQNLPERRVTVTQQQNFCDCGLYLLKYVSLFIKKSLILSDEILPRSLNVCAEEVKLLRGEIYNLIFQLSRNEEYLPFNEFKKTHRNYFKENIMINNTESKKNFIKLGIKNISKILSIRDAYILQKLYEPLVTESMEDFQFNIIVSCKDSVNQYCLYIDYKHACCIGAKEMIDEFFESKRWRCQGCKKPNRFNANHCVHCNGKKINYKTIINEIKKSGRHQVDKENALKIFFFEKDKESVQ